MYFKQLFTNTIIAFRPLSMPSKLVHCFWLLGPFILLVERTPADFWLTTLSLIFIIRSFFLNDYYWLNEGWVRLSLVFLAVCVVSSIFSDDAIYSLGETIAWFRFPLFAMAVVFWLGKDKAFLHGMLLSSGLAMVTMSFILFAEYFLIGQVGGRLSWPYGDLVPGNYLAKASMPVFVILVALLNGGNTKIRFCCLPIVIFTLLASVFSGERINFLLRFFAGALAVITFKPKPKNIFVGGCVLVLIVPLVSVFDPSIISQFVIRFIDQLPISFSSPYYRAAAPGVLAFLESPFLGVGPGNLRNLCSAIIGGSLNFDCHPHPHNFYIQILGETGVLGILAASLFIFSIVWNCWKSSRECGDNVLAKTAWITPFAFFWPISSTPDFFGQWNNIFMWSAISISIALARRDIPISDTVPLEHLNKRSKEMKDVPFSRGFLPRALLVFVIIILIYLVVSPYQNCKRDYATRFETKIKECISMTGF